MQQDIYITKSDGVKEKFSDFKLRRSLRSAGASLELAEQLVSHIKGEITEGISTDRIYEHAFSLLKKMEKPSAARYSLKRAIATLGPSGFPFEKFVAEIFKSMGYRTKTGLTLKGGCISHEVDVVALNENELVIVEAKFHNQVGTKSDAKVPLYVKSRIDDLAKTDFAGLKKVNLRVDPWIITNTKFTKTAFDYGSCVGINMVDWNKPTDRGLKDLIEDADLHPVTVITSLNKQEMDGVLQANIVLAKTLLDNSKILTTLGLTPQKIETVLDEVRGIVKKY
ncbi:MAG: ATP cone domain-containing protein [Patescibacteria group bacterium]